MNNLRAERARRGLSQMDLAKKISASQTTICAIEQGKQKPLFETMCKIADAFGISLDELRDR